MFVLSAALSEGLGTGYLKSEFFALGVILHELEQVEVPLRVANHTIEIVDLKKAEIAMVILNAFLLELVALLRRQHDHFRGALVSRQTTAERERWVFRDKLQFEGARERAMQRLMNQPARAGRQRAALAVDPATFRES